MLLVNLINPVIQNLNKAQWFLMYVFSRFNLTSRIASEIYRLRRPNHALKLAQQPLESNSFFPSLNTSGAIESLRKDGFCPDISLSQEHVAGILEYIKDVNCLPDHDGPRDLETGLSLSPDGPYKSNCSRSRYDNAFQNCPTIQALIRDPKLLQITTEYLQVEPVCMGARLWWSHAGAPPYDLKHAGQVFHYDIDDYRALRFFFYLTDVDLCDGTHAVIRGSHTYKRIKDRIATTRFRTDEDLASFYGAEQIITFTGKAGFGFAEDPSIFHKGNAPENRDRLILLLRYSMNDFGNLN